ncbi:HlyD family type I secretion periplasmic adaptor subunit [Rhodopseudomonas palustris]|uniref:Membrane fusion protein (MFP) family protein n=1 Tax=Rhodopseudomonas palustris (strain BisB18) TaxID=316056 RepID=Q20XV2_RHOPB
MKFAAGIQSFRLAFERDKRLMDAITLPPMGRESAAFRFARSFGLIASAGTAAAIIWASFAELNEVTQAVGSFTPVGSEQVVQHLEGGLVERIAVREGATVQKGDTLIVLRDAGTAEDDVALERQRVDLLAQIETQVALFEGREPAFTSSNGRYAVEEIANTNAFAAAKTLEKNEYSRLSSQIAQARYNREATAIQLKGALDEVENAERVSKRFADLMRIGVATGLQAEERRQAVVRARSAADAAASREQGAIERLGEVEKQLVSYGAELRSNRAQKVRDLEASLNVVDANIAKKNQRKQRLTITAPVAALVKSIEVNSIGQVVGSGQALATLVPLNTPLVAETSVRSSEIGYLRVGQSAQIRVGAYNFTRFGSLEGVVESISPSSFQIGGQYYYRVKIKPVDIRMPKAPGAVIQPGMEVTCEIITGRKTVMEYILTPLQRTLGSAFNER